MYLYIELWKAKDTWLALSETERTTFFSQAMPALGQMLQAGVIEPLGIALNDADTPLSSGYTFAAAWKLPNKETAQELENAVEAAGWHNYFEQVNARGEMLTLEQFAPAHISL